MTRTVILHYHLFKNAGTSLDRILKDNFANKWVTQEFATGGQNNTEKVEQWIRDTPDAIAYSSHTAMGPLPYVEGVRIIPVMLLREPIDRIKSAYRFERKQQADTWGANLAKQHDLLAYILIRLEKKGDRQCRNFQSFRLASLSSEGESELERALIAAKMLRLQGVLGLVEKFDTTVALLAQRMKENDVPFSWKARHENVSAKNMQEIENEDLMISLKVSNQTDSYLVNAELVRFAMLEAALKNTSPED